MNRNNDLDLEQQLPSVQLERGKSSETDFAEGDIENLEIYKLHTNAINQLVQMGYSLRAALLCVQITKSSAIEVNINFALMDERGVYTHPFLEKGTKKLCIICNDDQSKHDREADPKSFEKDRKTGINNPLNSHLSRTNHSEYSQGNCRQDWTQVRWQLQQLSTEVIFNSSF